MGDLRHQKMKKLFAYWDTDQNQYIEREDWLRILDRRAKLYEWSDAFYQAERAKAENAFAALLVFADTDEDGRVSWDEFVAYFEKMFPASESVSVEALPPMVQISVIRYVNEMDVNQDGLIEAEDYVRWFVDVVNGAEETGRDAFARIDRDGNGRLSTAELQQAVADFYLSADADAPGNWLFG